MKEQKHSMEVLFTMVTFLVYAMALLMFVSLGATVYRTVTRQMELHQTERTGENYLREKVRQNDRDGAIKVCEIEGTPALQIRQEAGEKTYDTYIYVHEGMLKELVVSSEKTPDCAAGTALLKMKGITFQEDEDGCLTVQLQVDEQHNRTFRIRRKGGSI